jgi:hypothetical protein
MSGFCILQDLCRCITAVAVHKPNIWRCITTVFWMYIILQCCLGVVYTFAECWRLSLQVLQKISYRIVKPRQKTLSIRPSRTELVKCPIKCRTLSLCIDKIQCVQKRTSVRHNCKEYINAMNHFQHHYDDL